VGAGGAVAGTGGGTAGATARGGANGGGAGNGGTVGAAGTGAPGTGGASAGTAGAAGGAGTGVAGSSGRGGTTGLAGRGGTGGGAAGANGTGGGAAGAAGSQCPSTATAVPGESNKSIMVGTLMRTYLLHIPTGYTGKTPLPVVFDFHGLGGSGSSQKGLSGWATLGDSKGFITVFPNGVGNSWICTQQGGSHCGNYASLGIINIAWEMFQKAALP
jgi:hypothetical protein